MTFRARSMLSTKSLLSNKYSYEMSESYFSQESYFERHSWQIIIGVRAASIDSARRLSRPTPGNAQIGADLALRTCRIRSEDCGRNTAGRHLWNRLRASGVSHRTSRSRWRPISSNQHGVSEMPAKRRSFVAVVKAAEGSLRAARVKHVLLVPWPSRPERPRSPEAETAPSPVPEDVFAAT